MNSRVTYLDESRGEARTVTLVHPSEADAALGRISVLSPIGRALLGQRPGAVVAVTASNGNAMRLRILGAEKASATHA